MIYNLEEKEQISANLDVESAHEQQFSIYIDCVSGYFLRSGSVTNATIYGRQQGTVDWINLETTGIDLSANDGIRAIYEVKVSADTITSRVTQTFPISVSL